MATLFVAQWPYEAGLWSVITEKELRDRLTARVETSTIIKPQDMQMPRNVAALLVPMMLKIIREEVRAARPNSGEDE